MEELRKAGFERTYKQCRDKVKVLKKRYKDVVNRLGRSGAGVESDEEITVSDFFVVHCYPQCHERQGSDESTQCY